MADLVEALREPGKVSSGIIHGNGGHIQTLVMMGALGVGPGNVRFVTYSGGAPLRTALAGNQVDFEILAAEAAESIRDRIRVLAVVSEKDKGGWNAPLLNTVLTELGAPDVPLIGGNVTGPLVHAQLSEKEPEHYEILVDAYRQTVESDEFHAWVKEAKIGADWVGPQKSQALVDAAYETLTRYADDLR